MGRLQQLGGSLCLVGIELLTQSSVVSAHAGEAHARAGADPWQVAGPVVALLVGAVAYWLANRERHQHDPAHPPTPDPVEIADVSPAVELVRDPSGAIDRVPVQIRITEPRR
jgi:hypothetical protein